jgi:flagellar biosynthesis/type III secretory pathway chaperone
MADQIDLELADCLTKLNKIQQEVGGGKKKVNIIGEDGKVDKFLELKAAVEDRLQTIRETYEVVQNLEKAGVNNKDAIQNRQKVKTELLKLKQEYDDLSATYNAEAKKKRVRNIFSIIVPLRLLLLLFLFRANILPTIWHYDNKYY